VDSKKLQIIGNLLILAGLFILVFTFWPVAKQEIKYETNKVFNIKPKALTAPNTDFSIVIPKIAAVAPIVDNVDSQDPKNYLPALYRGVAHAKGTAYPGQIGNTYLFAHSTDAFYNVGRYNAVFYLIGKLENGDEVDVWYKGQKIKYEVYEKRVVDANASQYLGSVGLGSTLTLQTCYPPGTTIKRLIVLARHSD